MSSGYLELVSGQSHNRRPYGQVDHFGMSYVSLVGLMSLHTAVD